MKWPAQSADHKPLGNRKRRLRKYEKAPTNIGDLWERIKMEWNRIPKGFVQHLVESIPKRANQVISTKGLWRHCSFNKGIV